MKNSLSSGMTRTLSLSWACCVFALVASAAPPYTEHQKLNYYLDEGESPHSIESSTDWQVRRQHVLEHMQSIMGELPQAKEQSPPTFQTVEETLENGLRRRKLRYHTDSDSEFVSAWLLEPVERDGRLPAVLCLHPTVAAGKDEPAGVGGRPHMNYGLQLARRGYVTLSPDYPSLGESTHDFEKDKYPSGSMQAIVDNMRGIDLLCALPSVDGQRIGAIGHSLGGHNTMFTAVFDPRIQVSVSSCGFTRFHKYYDGDLRGWAGPRYMPRIAAQLDLNPDLMPFDFTEIVGALAPRPFLAIAPLHDDNFEVSGVRDCIAAALPVYHLFGNRENLRAEYPDCGHEFPAAMREQAYDFFDKHLRN